MIIMKMMQLTEKAGSVQKALLSMLVIKQKMYCCKGRTFSKYKRYQHFFPESTEEIPSSGFPEIIFGTEMQTNK